MSLVDAHRKAHVLPMLGLAHTDNLLIARKLRKRRRQVGIGAGAMAAFATAACVFIFTAPVNAEPTAAAPAPIVAVTEATTPVAPETAPAPTRKVRVIPLWNVSRN